MVSHGRDSFMLGEISPHHEGCSKSSSETPPSYSQLNYKENIARFFESKPKTTFGSDENPENTKVHSAAGSEIGISGPRYKRNKLFILYNNNFLCGFSAVGQDQDAGLEIAVEVMRKLIALVGADVNLKFAMSPLQELFLAGKRSYFN